MRVLVAAAVVLGALAGCLDAAPAEPAPPAQRAEAPAWQSGFRWDFSATDGRYTQEAAYEALAPGQRLGEEGFMGWDPVGGLGRGGLLFASPSSLGAARIFGFGSVDDLCQDLSRYDATASGATAPALAPLLRFPLVVGETWTRESDAWGGHHVQSWSVVGWENVTVPAGTFAAIRAELRLWSESGDPQLAAYYEGSGQDEPGALRRPPAAVVHYAPAAQHVVRMERLGSVYPALPGLDSAFHPLGDAEARLPRTTITLQSLRLEGRAPLPDDEVAAHAHKETCDRREQQELERQAAEQLQAEARAFAVVPDLVDLGLGREARFAATVVPRHGLVAWRLTDATGTRVLPTGSGPDFDAKLPSAGLFGVEAFLTDAGGRQLASAYATVLADARIEGTFACAPAVGQATTCEAVPVPVPVGTWGVIEAEARHTGALAPPCGRVSIHAPEGHALSADVMEHGLARTMAWTELTGDHEVRFEPGGPMAGDVAYDILLEYSVGDVAWDVGDDRCLGML